jgi:hypothetical protein
MEVSQHYMEVSGKFVLHPILPHLIGSWMAVKKEIRALSPA